MEEYSVTKECSVQREGMSKNASARGDPLGAQPVRE
jgi:hypothetical protein